MDIFFGLLDSVSPDIADMLAKQALNHRLGTQLNNIADIFYAAHQKGLTTAELYAIPEQDSWMYNTTRNGNPAEGPSMVCCTFVCDMWKHGGLFSDIDSEVNCGELINWDVYALHEFNEDYENRPQVCIDNDPANVCCQLEGPYTLRFNDYNTRTPYAHMGEKCASQSPFYAKPPQC